jgi:Flp pilus assembly protein TadG
MRRDKFSSFSTDQRASTLITFAVALPVLLVGVAVAVDYAWLAHRHTTLQVAADSAALAATNELRLAKTGDERVQATAESVARSKLYEDATAGAEQAAVVTAEVLNNRSAVRVSIREVVPNPVGRVLSPESRELAATATARIAGTTLCLLGLDHKSLGVVHLEKNARVTAQGCAIYSNSSDRRGLQGDENASASASLICSAGGFEGRRAQFSPSPTTDCPRVPDPLKAQPAPSAGACPLASALLGGIVNFGTTISNKSVSLPPGTYCGLLITNGSNVTLQRDGIYVIKNGPLVVENGSSLSGQNVGFYFTGDGAGLRFDSDTTISLTAPKSGIMAGLLFLDDPNVTTLIPLPLGLNVPRLPLVPGQLLRDYRIVSDNARVLLGTIYLPGGRLIIDAKKPVADRSAYTVIVARRVELYDGPNLYLNTDYGSVDIPVPKGVGPNGSQVWLSR